MISIGCLSIESYFLSYFFAKIDFDECSSDACKNGATCEDLINGFKCRCPAGFSGTNCEIGMYHYMLSRIFLYCLKLDEILVADTFISCRY